jgi:hypothetical protein
MAYNSLVGCLYRKNELYTEYATLVCSAVAFV